MTGKRALIAITTASLLVSGCASQSGGNLKDSWWKCATAGGILGGAGGALDDAKSAGYGALAGAVLGGVICAVTDDEEAPVAETQPECEFIIAGWDVAVNGCPVDTDQDGVPDPLDQCPQTAVGTAVDETGCAVLVTTIEQEVYLDPVHFELSSAELTGTAISILGQEMTAIQEYPNSRVVVTGYTDTTGPLSFNEELSKNRARSVRDYLVNNGVDPSRIELYGDGPDDPIASNDNRPGREMNRRVQIVLKPQ